MIEILKDKSRNDSAEIKGIERLEIYDYYFKGIGESSPFPPYSGPDPAVKEIRLKGRGDSKSFSEAALNNSRVLEIIDKTDGKWAGGRLEENEIVIFFSDDYHALPRVEFVRTKTEGEQKTDV